MQTDQSFPPSPVSLFSSTFFYPVLTEQTLNVSHFLTLYASFVIDTAYPHHQCHVHCHRGILVLRSLMNHQSVILSFHRPCRACRDLITVLVNFERRIRLLHCCGCGYNFGMARCRENHHAGR